MIGKTIGKYVFVEQLGRGGMGTVYRAIDETLDREVAIKMINVDLLAPDALQRFRTEAVTLAKLKHPHIATIHELTRDAHDLLMVMEYVKGETLEKLLLRAGPLPIPTAVALCDQVLAALEHAHAAGVVHRDLKPSNVIVTDTGDVKVMDFGIARVIGSEHLTMEGHMMGTPAYMAPEQVRGEEVDPRMDLYSAAVLLYRLVTQHLPFKADTAVGLIHLQLTNPPTPPKQFRADLPDWLEATLSRGLAKAPGDRFQTAREFRTVLEEGLGGGTLSHLVRPVLPQRDTSSDDVETLGIPTPTAVRRARSTAVPQADSRAIAPPLPPPPPTPPQLPVAPDTVTLRRPHLLGAAALLVLLVIAVGVLAVATLRRSAPVASTTAMQPPLPPASSAAAGDGPQAAAATPPPPTGSTSTPEQSSPPVAAPPPQATAAATPSPPQTAVPPSRGDKPTTSRPSDGASARSSQPTKTSGGPAETKPSVLDARSTVAPVPIPAAPRETKPVPEPTAEPVVTFGNVKAVVLQGLRGEERDAMLGFESGNIVVRSRDLGSVIKSMPYRNVEAATYTKARRPRWKDPDAGLAPVPESLGGSGFFLGSAKHWLTLQSKTDYLILRLDDKNYRLVLGTVAARTGTIVDIPVEK